MSRGSQTLFNDIFQDAPAEPAQKKGRSTELHAKRNECLIDRYYYYGKFEKWRYDVILETLCTQFFISPITISEAIDGSYSYLSKLKNDKPEPSYFKKKWPHLVW